MFGGLFNIPMMIRLVLVEVGVKGTTFSNLQSLLAHIPGLTVLMPSNPYSILRDYRHAVSDYKSPVIFLEHRFFMK